MQFDVLESVSSEDKIENGVWAHVEKDGMLLYADPATKLLPTRALIRSHRSSYFKARDFSSQTSGMAKARRAKAPEQEQAMAAAQLATRTRQFSFLLLGLENASKATPGIVKLSEADAYELGKRSNMQWLVDFVLGHSFVDENYAGDYPLPEEADEADPPPPAPDVSEGTKGSRSKS